jgi:hypothetical protein
LNGISLSAELDVGLIKQRSKDTIYTRLLKLFFTTDRSEYSTGKDSLSMKQKYPTEEVIAPGTVIISLLKLYRYSKSG